MSSLSVSERTAINVEDVSVTYRTSFERAPTLRSTMLRLGRRERVVREIEAVRNVSFDVPHGTVLGVVGANGAGKSTLMRTIAGILPPSAGRVEVHGRVSTLLALGVGFNRKLSGRENVVLGGLAAGLKREQLAEKYDDIVAFAELEDFMDMPMRTYSSGMYGRLAFSVAVNMDPDILLIDEALSVGDARFRRKSARQDARAVRRGPHGRARLARARHDPGSRRPGDLDGQGRAADVGRAGVGDQRLHGVPRGRAGRGHARGDVAAIAAASTVIARWIVGSLSSP